MGYISYSEKLLDPRWQKKRLEVFQRENFTCQFCGEKEKTLHVHHLCYSETRNPWDVDDYALMCLCTDCHSIGHLKNLTSLEQELIEKIQFWAQAFDGKDELTNIHIRCINEVILKHKKNG